MDNDNAPQDYKSQPRPRRRRIGSKSFHVSPPLEEASYSTPNQLENKPAKVLEQAEIKAQPINASSQDAAPNPEPRTIKPPKKPHRKRKKSEGGAFSLILTIIVAIVFVQIINAFFFQSYRVVGHSMHPTLEEGDFLIISKIGRSFSKISRSDYEPSRGDVIVFKSPRDELQLVKRVIGLPGERVVVEGGGIIVYNDENPDGFDPDADTDYVDSLPITTGNVDVDVPEGHLFVSGDNREGGNSLDSRNELGTIPESLVVGTLSVRIFPLSKARFF